MDSVISRQGLDMLLSGMANSISREKIQRGLETIKFDSIDKQGFYFGIIEILKTTSDPKLATAQIVESIEGLIMSKAIGASEAIFEEGSGEATEAQPAHPGKLSPIFRRVG